MIILGILGWIVIGLIVAYIATKVVDLHGDDPRLGSAVACGGALVMATLYSMISGAGVSAWNWWSMVFALIGAIAGVLTWHVVRSRYVSREAYTTRRSY